MEEEEVGDEEPGDEGEEAQEVDGVPLHPCPCSSVRGLHPSLPSPPSPLLLPKASPFER